LRPNRVALAGRFLKNLAKTCNYFQIKFGSKKFTLIFAARSTKTVVHSKGFQESSRCKMRPEFGSEQFGKYLKSSSLS